MCLQLYIASPRPFVGAPPSPLQIAIADPATTRALRGTFANGHVARVTVDGCSCAFPSVASDGPVEYFDGLLGDATQRAVAASHTQALLQLVERSIAPGEHAEVFPVWIGHEAEGVKGSIDTSLAAIDPESFCFAESHLYRMRA